MYEITKRFEFSASHILTGLPAEHPCSRLHGHNYIVKFRLRATKLDAAGMVVDYRKLDKVKEWIDRTLDHRHLNDVEILQNLTTAENIARCIYATFCRQYPELYAVEVSETPKTNAIFCEVE